MTTFMAFGEVTLELLSSPTAFTRRSSANYAEQNRIGRKSGLQYTGQSPDDISITIRLHSFFCNPGLESAKLEDLKDRQVVFPVAFANGEYQGTFVLKSTDTTTTEATADGYLIGCDINLTLAEYVGDAAKPNPPGVRKAGAVLFLSPDPAIPNLETPAPATLFDNLAKAAEVVNQVGEASAKVNAIVQKAQSGDLLGAISQAGTYAPRLTEMAAMLPVDEFQNLEQVKNIAVDAGAVAKTLTVTQTNLTNAASLLSSGSGLSAFSSASSHLSDAMTVLETAAPALARLDALAQVGSRLAGVVQ